MSAVANLHDDDPISESAAFADLVKWSADRPAWQQDALRRLVVNGTLEDADFEALAALCLDPKAAHEPFSAAHVAAEATTAEPITLGAIEKPKGINALAPDQRIAFARDGLTVIYGDNGSGKSGYVRILKHACRTRDGNLSILRDVEDTSATPQSADITFGRGATDELFAWTPNAPGHADLPSVSIFDSRSANIHVEKTNAVAYIPRPMQVLEALANACDAVKDKLNRKLATLKAQTPRAISMPTLRDDTAAGKFIRQLSEKSSTAQLDILATLTDEQTKRLTTLEADFAQDPKRAVDRLNGQNSRLQEGVAKIIKLADASADAAFTNRDNFAAAFSAKSEAAKAASDALFAASPLPEVGQAAWRALWEAARAYADGVAYPGKAFPEATADQDLCVLCQQPLSAEAVERRHTFESYVKGVTRAEEEAAAQAVAAARKAASDAVVPVAAIRQLCALIATEIGDAPLASEVRRACLIARLRLRALLRGGQAPAVQVTLPSVALTKLTTDLTARAIQLAADQSSDDYKALLQEYRELKDREALGPLVEDIKAEIDRRKQAAEITKAIKDTAKNSITTKNREISDRLVTNALRGRFAREIEKLKLSRMPVELRKTKDQSAVSYFQVALVEKPNEPVGEIFSEGEHRCVALAAFLAELVTSKRKSGIVFDDPMSSLDHIHRKAVAARLVEEAAHRQVIVFTHDLTFLYELRREAEAKDCAISYQTVRRRQDKPGYVEGELPNKAKSGLQLTNALRSELKDAKPHYDGWNDTKRTVFAKGVIEQLREAWDQGVADFIFPVLGRFDNHIKGNSLYKLAVLTEEDVKTVTAARGRLSEDLHASAETLNPETVAHADLVAEVAKLEVWLQSIDQRQKAAQKPVTSYA